MPKEDSLEDKVKNTPVQSSSASKKDWNLGTIVTDIAKYAPLGIASFLTGGTSSLIVAAGFGLGYFVEKRKNKEKTNWDGLFKEIYTGNLFGSFSAGCYTLINSIPNVTLEGQITRFLVFNPLVVSGFNYVYRNFVYLRDKIGWGKVAKGIGNGEISTHLKEAHEKDIKPNYMKSNVMNFFALGPIHYFNLNFIADSMIPLKVALGTINSLIFRLIGGKKKSTEEYKPAIQQAPKQYPSLDEVRNNYRNTG